MNPINISIDGTLSLRDYAWTGTLDTGTEATSHSMGNNNVFRGRADLTSTDWVHAQAVNKGNVFAVYGISEVLTVPSTVPEPSTAMLAGLGGLAALVYSFKRKRN